MEGMEAKCRSWRFKFTRMAVVSCKCGDEAFIETRCWPAQRIWIFQEDVCATKLVDYLIRFRNVLYKPWVANQINILLRLLFPHKQRIHFILGLSRRKRAAEKCLFQKHVESRWPGLARSHSTDMTDT